jgi:hypothetical protein
MPTPTPLPKAPKSRWDTNPEPTAEESQEKDLLNAQTEFNSAWYPFSDKQRALLKEEQDGWDAYLATIQGPALQRDSPETSIDLVHPGKSLPVDLRAP